jgi:magnesium chelatase family protein
MPQIQRYRSRVSGPLLDRIDIHVEAPAVRVDDLQDDRVGESSYDIRNRIKKCRAIQAKRYLENKLLSNANITNKMLIKYCKIGTKEAAILKRAMNELSLSARAYDKILKVSRTIADLADSENIEMNHLLEAIQYRSLDRSLIL